MTQQHIPLPKDNHRKINPAPLIFLVAAVLLPIPFRNQNYTLLLFCMFGLYIISVSGLDLLLGYSGQISIGHAGFYGIGAYVTAILSVKLKVPVFLSIPIAVATAVMFALLLAYPATKLVHHFLALLTSCFGQLFHLFVTNFSGITGGFSGINFIPRISVPRLIPPFGFEPIDTNFEFYYLVLFFACVFLLLKNNIVHSRIGRAFIAIRDNTHAADGSGVPVVKYKMMAFAISAAFTSFSGCLYAHFITFISPESFMMNQSVIFLTMLLFGGLGNFVGPIVGAIFITFINEQLQVFGDYQMIIYGAFIIAILMFMPKGLIGAIEFLIGKIKDGRRKTTNA